MKPEDMILQNPTRHWFHFAAVIVLLFWLIAKSKWHVFLALLLPIVLFALVPGINLPKFISAFESGFGKTVQGIAIVIVLGSIIAEALKNTGGIEKVTLTMVKWVGEKRMPLALPWQVSSSVLRFSPTLEYVILNPLVHGAAIAAGTNMSVMATGLVGAMQLTHAMVPPTPGPLGCCCSYESRHRDDYPLRKYRYIVGSIAGWVYAKIVGPKVPSPPSREFLGQSFVETGRELPSTVRAYAPILVPLILIALQSIFKNTLAKDHILNSIFAFIGWPVVAMLIGVALCYINVKDAESKKAFFSPWIEDALRTSAMIIVVTGLGGSLSEILKGTPAVDTIAKSIAASGIPAIFLPFVLGIVGNLITGSTTVGVITAASLTAPMLGTLGLSPEAGMLAGAAGSVIIK